MIRNLTPTSTRTKSTSVRFRRIDVTPDPILNMTPSPRSSHGLSALSCGTRLVLYGGEETTIGAAAENDTHRALWIAERTSTKSRPSSIWKYPFDHPTENDRWQWQFISAATDESSTTTTVAAAAAVPPPRFGHSQVSVGNITYIMGGIGTKDQQPLNDMWKLEILRHDDDDDDDKLIAKWTQIQYTKSNSSNNNAVCVVPMPRSYHKMITINSSIYLFGGCCSGGDGTAADDKQQHDYSDNDSDQRQYHRLNDLWKFDTIHETWTELGKSHLLLGGAGPALLSLNKTPGNYDSRIAVITAAAGGGGEDDDHRSNNNNNKATTTKMMMDGHIYSASTASWELNGLFSSDDDILCNNKLSKRSASCFGSFPKLNRCLIFGGKVDSSSSFENDIIILDGTSGAILDVVLSTSQWELDTALLVKEDNMPSWPEARGYADGCVGMDGETMYIFGGLTAGDDSINGTPKRLNDLWECKVVVSD